MKRVDRVAERLQLHYDGSVVRIPPIVYRSSCKIDMTNFPYDEQHCDFKFGTWSHSADQMDMVSYRVYLFISSQTKSIWWVTMCIHSWHWYFQILCWYNLDVWKVLIVLPSIFANIYFSVCYIRPFHATKFWSRLELIFNPLAAKLFNLNFHPLEDVSRWRDPQLHASEKYLDLI